LTQNALIDPKRGFIGIGRGRKTSTPNLRDTRQTVEPQPDVVEKEAT
jgi:hypothetical protein